MERNKIERKDIVRIDNKEVVLESAKDFNEFRKRYNKYDFMQNRQINTWETKLKEPTGDPVPEPTIRDVAGMVKELANVVNNLTLEVREGFRRVNNEIVGIKTDINTINVRLDRIEEKLERNNIR